LTYHCWNLGWHDLLTSYTKVLYCDLLESQTDFHFTNFFPQCVCGLFLRSVSQIVCPWWTRGWLDINLREILGLCWILTELWFLLPCSVPESDQAHGSDWMR
jgi:hypothetical protein